MAASREVEYWYNWTGGLNLSRNTQSIPEDQTPEAVNVDFGLRGGITLRGGFRVQATSALLDGGRIIGAADKVYLQANDGSLLTYDGSLTDTTDDVTDDNTERVRMAAFRTFDSTWQDKIYFANGRSGGNIIMQEWNGSALSTLGNAWNNDYLAPTTGNMPLARHIASHNGFMWVADTVESGTRYPARVRFSHEQNVESWAEADWFNVGEPGLDDPITSLVPFGSMLLVFKLSSVWAVYGYDRDTFVLERITNASGTCTCGAIAVNSGVAYWFSTDGQLMAFNGDGVAVLSEPIDYWSQIGKIKHGGAHRLMWSDGRLWLSLEAGSGEAVSKWLFIWNPMVKAFTRYSRDVTDLVHWDRFTQDGDPLFLENGSNDLMRYDTEYETDQVTAGVQTIVGEFRTAWMTAGETATRKRWKRPRVTAASTAGATIKVEVFMDFEDRTPVRTMEFVVETPEDASLWGTMVWGVDDWYSPAEEYYEFERLSSSGSGYAVSYKFSSTDNAGRWWIDGIAVPFRRKQVR